MRRAALDGVIDYSKCDPDDTWWWQRHRSLLAEFESRLSRELRHLEHAHYSMLAAGNLTPESAENVRSAAGAAFNAWWKLQMPWLAETIGEAGMTTQDEKIAKQ